MAWYHNWLAYWRPPILSLPLLPLHDVLFPGGTLSLSMTDLRYQEMIGHVALGDRRVGLCGMQEDPKSLPKPWPVGTLAEVTVGERVDAVLHLTVRALQRFRVEQTVLCDNGLLKARVRLLPILPVAPLPEPFTPCAELLRKLEPQLADPADRTCWGDSAWVSNRLAERLPLKPLVKHNLLQLDDPLQRLQVIERFLRQQALL